MNSALPNSCLPRAGRGVSVRRTRALTHMATTNNTQKNTFNTIYLRRHRAAVNSNGSQEIRHNISWFFDCEMCKFVLKFTCDPRCSWWRKYSHTSLAGLGSPQSVLSIVEPAIIRPACPGFVSGAWRDWAAGGEARRRQSVRHGSYLRRELDLCVD
jgi:hypothetical protein